MWEGHSNSSQIRDLEIEKPNTVVQLPELFFTLVVMRIAKIWKVGHCHVGKDTN